MLKLAALYNGFNRTPQPRVAGFRTSHLRFCVRGAYFNVIASFLQTQRYYTYRFSPSVHRDKQEGRRREVYGFSWSFLISVTFPFFSWDDVLYLAMLAFGSERSVANA